MSTPLSLPEIQTEVCRSLELPDLCRVALVSRSWDAVATPEVWRVLPGLWPLTRLIPPDATSKSSITVLGHSYVAYHVDRESPTLHRFVRLAGYVQALKMETVLLEADLRLCAGMTCVPALAKSLFPAIQEIRTTSSILHVTPGAATADLCDLAVLTSAFPHARDVKIGCPTGTPVCWSFHHISTFSIMGLKLDVARTLLSLRSAWSIDMLQIEAPTAVSGADVSKLASLVAERCTALHHLSIDVESFEDGKAWSLTPEILRTLSNLDCLTCLALAMPLVATLSDPDYEAAAWSWPHLQIFDITDRHSHSAVHSACTLDGLLFIAVHCPRMTDLCLPAIDCRTIPSPDRTAQAVQRSPSGIGYPLEILHFGDGTILAPQEVGRFLHTLFYRLVCCL
ncbi:hypothetical protein EV714DRAFT_240434 [Schizophyllum commune]